MIYELSGSGMKLGPSRYYDGVGHEVTFEGKPPDGTIVFINPSTTQVWTPSGDAGIALRTTEIQSGDHIVTRIVEEVDRVTGRVLIEKTYENTNGANPNDPNIFRIIGVYDPETGMRQSINRQTGLLQQTTAPNLPEPVDLSLNEGTHVVVPNLLNHFTGDQNSGAYGAGQLGGYDVLPFNENSSFLVNADGDMIGEINRLPNGYTQVKELGGNTFYFNEEDATVLTQDQYQQAQTQAWNSVQVAQASQAANAVGLMNSIISLQHWDSMSDLQRTAAAISIYNAVDKIAGNALPGDLGSIAGALGVLNALDRGDIGGVIYTSLNLVESMTYDAATKMGWVGANMPGGESFLPGLGLVLALDSGDPMSILAAAANFIPVYGQIISIAISIFGSLLGDDAPNIPMREGLAHAQWDAVGNTVVITDQDIEGGGASATDWMNSLVEGLNARLAAVRDQAGNAYAMVPNLLPAIGFQYDPDGFNLANGAKGFVYLKWTDENGQSQTRYYDGAGSRGDGTGETLAGDFMQHAAGAIAPAWQVQTVLAHYQQGLNIELPHAEAGLPQVLADGIHQALQAITLALPVEPALQNALIDVDGDGYLERTQWLATNQQVLAIDSNANGLLDRLDARWGEFGAWTDKNGNGISEAGEFQTLDEVGITQIGLQSDQQVHQPVQGVTELGQSRFTWTDGRTGAVGDVAFAVDETDRLPVVASAATATAEVHGDVAAASTLPLAELVAAPAAAFTPAPVPMTPEHIALLMVQVISTATAAWEAARESGSLACVEMHGPQDVHQSLVAAQAEWAQTAQASFVQWHGGAS